MLRDGPCACHYRRETVLASPLAEVVDVDLLDSRAWEFADPSIHDVISEERGRSDGPSHTFAVLMDRENVGNQLRNLARTVFSDRALMLPSDLPIDL